MIRRTISILALLVTFSFSVVAKPIPEADFTHIDTRSGLPSNSVRDIKQDSQGFMWFATDGGLVRYDGREMRIFDINSTHIDKDPTAGFLDNFIATIYEKGGILWIGEDSGLYNYNPHTDLIKRVPVPDRNGVPRYITEPVGFITADFDGNLWIVVQGHGIVRYNPEMGTTQWYDINEWNNNISELLVDSNNNIWAIGYVNPHGLQLLDRAADEFRPVNITNNAGQTIITSASSIGEDSEGKIWLGSTHHGLICFDPYTRRQVEHFMTPGTRSASHVHSITEIEPGLIAFGSNNGLGMFDWRTLETRYFLPDELNSHSISNSFVYPVTLDEEGGLWVGTFYGGINYLAPQLKPFRQYLPSAFRNSVKGNVISRFEELPDGVIAIASDDGGLSLLNPVTGKFSSPDIFPPSHSQNLHALENVDNTLWIGSYGDGITAWNRNNNTRRHYTTVILPDGKEAEEESAYDIYRNSKGRIYAGTMNGINVYDPDIDKFRRLINTGAMVIDIEEIPTGELLFATQGAGIYVLNPDGSWKIFKSDDKSGLPHNHVNSIESSAAGDVYVATQNGLVKYDSVEHKFEPMDTGIDENIIMSVISDQHTLWLTTPKGIWRLVNGGQGRMFGSADGVAGESTVANTLFKSSDGCIYSGANHGFTAFYPYQLKDNPHVPPLALTDIRVNHNVYTPSGSETVAVNDIKEIEVPYGHNSVTVNFAALSYVNPGKNSYRFRLDGYEKDWVDGGNQNFVRYTNLEPGKYVLHIQGSNNDGVWNAEGLSLVIRVLPPWWATWWMKAIYSVVFIALIALMWLWAARRSEREHTVQIERLERRKEHEVYDAKMKFFTMIAHEIRTPVSLIKGPLEKILRNSENLNGEQRADLEVISRNNNRLLKLINQLLDFKSVENAGLVNEFTSTDIPTLVKITVDRFASSMQKKGISIEMKGVDSGFVADIDAEAFTKLLSNLLNNARKYALSKVNVDVRHSANESTFTVVVADDGPGIPKESLPRIFEAFYRTEQDERTNPEGGSGIGLSIVKNVTDAHGGNVKVYNGDNGGAVFEVTLPLIHDKEPQRVMPKEKADSEKPTLLFVDDNADMVDFITSSFSNDYNILSANNGREALQTLKDTHPDIIVSDWMMPGMDGLQLCEAIRTDSEISHIPFIMLTARTDDVSKTQGYEKGVDGYLEKPFSITLLSATVSNILERRRELQKRYTTMPLEPLHSVALTLNDTDILQQMENIIQENLTNPALSVDFIADKMKISRSTLYNKIKILADITPNELIQLTRLKHAAVLLQDGHYRVNEICYMVGFNSPSYFAKCFQKQFGVRPNDFTKLSPDSDGGGVSV